NRLAAARNRRSTTVVCGRRVVRRRRASSCRRTTISSSFKSFRLTALSDEFEQPAQQYVAERHEHEPLSGPGYGAILGAGPVGLGALSEVADRSFCTLHAEAWLTRVVRDEHQVEHVQHRRRRRRKVAAMKPVGRPKNGRRHVDAPWSPTTLE